MDLLGFPVLRSPRFLLDVVLLLDEGMGAVASISISANSVSSSCKLSPPPFLRCFAGAEVGSATGLGKDFILKGDPIKSIISFKLAFAFFALLVLRTARNCGRVEEQSERKITFARKVWIAKKVNVFVFFVRTLKKYSPFQAFLFAKKKCRFFRQHRCLDPSL